MQRRNFLKISGSLALAGAVICLAGCGGGAQSASGAGAPDNTPLEVPADMQLFLLIGQSNMVGIDSPQSQDRATDKGIWMFNLDQERQWRLARDPMHLDRPRPGVGPGHQFARNVKRKFPTATIGLIPAAKGGTSLDKWRAGGPLYKEAVARTRAAMKQGQLKGILWHQGEADPTPAQIESYPTRFAAMIAQLRADLDAPDVPVVIGELIYSRDGSAAFNRRIPDISAAVPNCDWVSARGLRDKGDRIHFSTASARTLGERYAAKYLELEKRGR